MNQIGIVSGIILIVLAAPTLSCTWAPLTNQGQGVRVLQESEVSSCQTVGRATAVTRDQFALFARNDRKVRQELESLGRNEGAEMGGDAIVPVGSPKDGRQSFDVYRCGAP